MKPKTENRGNLQVNVAIDKSDIPAYIAMQDCTNSLPVKLGDKTHKSRTVRFIGAALALKDGKYRGEYRFMTGDFASDIAQDLNQLPGLNGAK
jgi:hypothetical protein